MWVGVLPYARNIEGQYYFLLGKEHNVDGWYDSGKWAHFAGGLDPGEDIRDGAVREAYEESMGFLGTRADKAKLNDDNLVRVSDSICVYLIEIDYNPNLPKLFSDVYHYFLEAGVRTDKEGFFEKVEIGWWSFQELHTSPVVLRRDFPLILNEVFRSHLLQYQSMTC